MLGDIENVGICVVIGRAWLEDISNKLELFACPVRRYVVLEDKLRNVAVFDT